VQISVLGIGRYFQWDTLQIKIIDRPPATSTFMVPLPRVDPTIHLLSYFSIAVPATLSILPKRHRTPTDKEDKPPLYTVLVRGGSQTIGCVSRGPALIRWSATRRRCRWAESLSVHAGPVLGEKVKEPANRN
jgi:hypothetical protein